MAEFKLGRIRFVWKGDWAASTVYWKDDVVRHGGNTYICTKGYTSTSDFQNDLATYWNKSSDGQEWKGDWAVATYYKINDIVKNGGYLYVANEGHTSAATLELGLENDQAKWDLFAEFFNYNADWTIATAYKINDIVKYGGTAYICITSHTSAATTALGLEQDQAKWQIFSEGFNWKDTWTANYRYRVNDIVRDGGIMYVCITGHTSAATNALGLEADQAKWQYAHKGIDYRSDWTTGTRYKVNDVVKDGGGIWICITHHTSQTYFTDDQAKWSQFVEGLEFEDSWDPGTRYQPGDMITYGGYSYVAITNNLEKRPIDNPTDWDLFTTGFRFREDWGDDSTNEEYHVGDVVRLGGYTYLCKADSSGHRPPNATYWERLNSGMYWKNAHADATLYDAGDTVRQGVSSYICVAGHTSNTGVNDPANDGAGAFWNMLAGGPETDVLTTAGDLLYHSGAGAARLPIGTAGQVLSVNTAGNAPEWAAYGKINNIFYADSSIGVNEESPSYGVTLSRPWKNLQYACDQIDRGALRPDAKKLLIKNKAFIQKEVREFVVWNVANPTGIWVSYTCDNLDKCERDQGYIVDALIHDLSHGGNKGMRDLTMHFFNGGHYPYAERLIENNKQFLIDEVMAWFDATNPTVHTPERHALCERDVGYNIDAIIHDIKHGGQDETVRVAKLYWSGASSQLGAGEIVYAANINNKVRDLINNNILTNSGSPSRYQNRGKITTDPVHGRSVADLVEVRDIAVTCPQGSKTYPIVSTTTAFTVLGTGLTATEFQVNLGTSSVAQSYVSGGTVVKAGGARLAITDFDYNTGTGIATITTATHTLSASDTVNLFGIVTSCVYGKKVYPQMPFSGIYAAAEAPTTTTLNIFLPPSEIEHNYTSGGTVKLATPSNVGGSTAITNFVYDNTTGYTTVTSTAHTLAIGDYVKLDAITVSCSLGGNVENKIYPNESITNNLSSGIFTVYDVPDANTYVIALDKSAIVHTYVSGGTSQKVTIATSASVGISDFTFANGSSTQWFDVGDGEASSANRITYLTSVLNDITQNGLASVPTSLPLLTSINDEIDQTKAAADYGTTVIDAVLSNVAPGTNYQTLNGVSPAITQVIDSNLTEENDAQTLVTSLTSILTTALGTTASPGTSALVPAELIAGNTVFAKTGRFDEVLPIIVPVNTAIVGDELRSVRVYAGSATVTDSVKVLAGINRLKAVISDIVQNTAITKTTGNSETQNTARPDGSAGAGTKSEGLIQELYDYIDWGVNGASGDSTVPLSTGSNFTVSDTGYTHAVEVLEANRTFIKAEIIAFIVLTYPAYTGYATKCERDLDFFIDAVQYDLVHNTGASGVRPYEGNYKTLHYARYYVNSTTGNALEDMFYMRNATGLRNMSLNGLAGGLGTANSFGTQRPTAGAFISLDPGWGPDDTRTWITTKSPYAQNVTNFGDGCIGLKVDGSIHNGGYDSVVANDFTQIINDGIGAWVTNLARVELVSVFTYYCHIGYLAENGGKIRATNGNNSYGNYGSVAEKTDDAENAITGTVDNRSTEANIDQVITNGDDILTFEFLNAGVNYTGPGTTITPAGDGFGAVIASSNIKNGAVYEVRLLDPADNLGGTGYVTASGKAQAGNLTSITISNTDTGSNTTYIGMNVFITSGVGAGQFGYIDTFNSTSKVATVRKHSDGNAGWDHVLGDDSTTYPTLNDTTTYVIEPRVTFASPPSGHPWDDCAKGRAKVTDGKIEHIRIWDPGSGYVSAPSMTLTDPNNTVDAPNLVRIGNGVLTQPTWTNRGTDFETATATVSGDGYADTYQPGSYMRISGMSDIPQDGANIAFGGIPNTWYKLVQTTGLTGSPGTYTGLVQLSPKVSVTNAPEHGESVEFTIRYSQVRLTGHDFLDVGTGDFTETNYPGTPSINPDQTKETSDFGGGRCFYTATDQDGNFRVGELFNIEQSTGIATLNAEAFNISGLQSLQLGAVELGGTGAVITEFSTDGTFTANSDEIVPTQRAIKTYISSQIGGGAGELNVNSMVAGVVQINSNQITTTTGVAINIASSINFQAGVSGQPLAINYFLKA